MAIIAQMRRLNHEEGYIFFLIKELARQFVKCLDAGGQNMRELSVFSLFAEWLNAYISN